jgi:4-aminobutyrate aminotransferase
MIGIELVRDQVTKEPATELCTAVLYRAFEHGLLLLSCGRSVVPIVPALNISPTAAGGRASDLRAGADRGGADDGAVVADARKHPSRVLPS